MDSNVFLPGDKNLHKILHVIDSLERGGAEHQLLLNLAALDSNLYENYVCTVQDGGPLAKEAANLGAPVFSLGAAGKPQWPRAIIRLGNLVRDLQIELIHTSLFSADMIGGLVGRLSGVPVVATLCSLGGDPANLVDNPNLNRFKLSVTTRLWALALRACHSRYIAISNAVKDSAIRTYGLSEAKVTLIYRALSESWFDGVDTVRSESLRHSLGLTGAYPILINVGRLVPQKGQSYLIQAMPKVLEEFPQAKLLIAGEGPLHEQLSSLILNSGVDGHVNALGCRQDVKDLLAISDIFVFPSISEGLGVSLLEAAAMGKPCVASRIGPLPEVLEDGESGLLVPPQSPAMLAEAVVYLAKNPEIAQAMGRRGHQALLEKFTIDRTIKQLEQVYMQVLQAAGRTRGQEPKPVRSRGNR